MQTTVTGACQLEQSVALSFAADEILFDVPKGTDPPSLNTVALALPGSERGCGWQWCNIPQPGPWQQGWSRATRPFNPGPSTINATSHSGRTHGKSTPVSSDSAMCGLWLSFEKRRQRPEQERVGSRGRLADCSVCDGAPLPQQFFPQRHAHAWLRFEVNQR